MSPAGAAAASYRDVRIAPFVTGVVLVAVVGGLVLLGGGRAAHAAQAPVAPLLPAWAAFQADCVAGPSPGQGFPAVGCRCWEAHLERVDIPPPFAVGILLTAQGSADERWMVVQNLGQIGAWDEMDGCDL